MYAMPLKTLQQTHDATNTLLANSAVGGSGEDACRPKPSKEQRAGTAQRTLGNTSWLLSVYPPQSVHKQNQLNIEAV